jgi:glucan phosphorylase
MTHVLCEQVVAKAYDNPIPGYKTNTVGNLRLWEATPVEEFKSVLRIIKTVTGVSQSKL